MSADNYILVDREQDGTFRVWNGSASADEHPRDYCGNPVKVFGDVLEALGYAYQECEDSYVEYGVTLSEEVRKELPVARIKKDAALLTGFAWKKSDESAQSSDRNGWGFVASHAEEIVRSLMKERG